MFPMLAILISASSFWIWNEYYRETKKYYTDFIDRWAIPNGILELTKDQAFRRNNCYQFIYKGGKLRSVTSINAYGRPSTPVNTVNKLFSTLGLKQQFIYNESGKLQKVDYLNEKDSVEKTFIYAGEDLE
ncbi:MAG: hypothetical protein ABI687_03060 [Flavitalea sp.]